MIVDLQEFDACEIQLTMAINFISQRVTIKNAHKE